MSKKINDRCTKDVILKAYEISELEKKELEKQLHDVKKQQDTIENEVVTKSAESFKGNPFDSLVALMTKESQQLESLKESFKNIKEAVKLKEEELKALYGFEKKAFDLTTLVNAEKQIKAEHEAELEVIKLEMKNLEIETKQKIKDAETESNKKIKDAEKIAEDRKKKDIEEWTYEFARTKKIESDKLQDKLVEIRKSQELELKLREDEVTARESKMDALFEENESLKAKLQAVIEQTKAEVTEKLKTSHGFETRYLKKEYEANISLLESKIETLTQQLADKTSEKAYVDSKLDEAYNKIELIASKTVEGASNSKMYKDMQDILKTNNNK